VAEGGARPAAPSGLQALGALCRPQRVAVVGGSADPGKIAGRPVRFLHRGGFAGASYLVNPNLPEVAGFTSVGSVAALPEVPDAAFVALGTAGAIAAVRELAALGTAAAVVLAAGFTESGAEGAKRQAELLAAAGPMRLLGPNTLGLVNLSDGVYLTASDALETPGISRGAVGVAAQSGGIMASLLSRAGGRGIGFSTLLATGNEADLELADCVEYLTEDDNTAVIALYIEALRSPRRFVEVARRAVAAGKAVLAYKVGRSEAGALAASSHTGALAGSDRAYDALFAEAGVERLTRFTDLLELPAALAAGKRSAGRRVGVLTTTGGAATVIADACGALGLVLPGLGAATAAALGELVPGGDVDASHNPIDLTLAGTRSEVMAPVIELLAACDDFDALVVVLGSSAVARPRLVADPLIACAARPGAKPLLAYVSPHLPEVLERLNRAGVPAFEDPESCAAALALLAATSPPAPFSAPPAAAPHAAAATIGDEVEAKELLARHGIPSPRRAVAAEATEAARLAAHLTPPFALKALVRGLAHKSDVGGVALGVALADVPAVGAALLARVGAALGAPPAALLVEEMAHGEELLLGMVRDPGLGALIVLGAGGVAAELVDDTVLRLAPVDRRGAEEMIASLRLAPLLQGARGREPVDLEALAEAVVSFSALVEELGETLAELEVNPLVVGAAGEGVLALDAVVGWSEAMRPQGSPS